LSIPPLPGKFAQTILELHGAKGRAWLEGLPALIATCAQRWSLTILPPFPLSYHYVAPAEDASRGQYVLKLGVPEPLLANEISALRHFAGGGAARLVYGDAQSGVLLLERLLPGRRLTDLMDDEEATRIAAGVMHQLWKPPPAEHNFPTAARWAAGMERLRAEFDGGCGPFPVALVERAEALFAELLPSSADPVLLHGDLHHENILYDHQRGWLAIDPQGVIGEPAFEPGALLYNPLPHIAAWPDLPRLLCRRLDLLTEVLNLDRQRLHGWGLARAVLSAWWDYEDHGHGWEAVITVAEVLTKIR